VVKGEGIYFELDGTRLAAWEGRAEVQARAQRITDHYGSVASQRGLQGRTISPRFVLLHTLSHLLINEFIFACGYSSASLRERLYVSDSADRNMAGVLIYSGGRLRRDDGRTCSHGTPGQPAASFCLCTGGRSLVLD
jgi:hypothetical protein